MEVQQFIHDHLIKIIFKMFDQTGGGGGGGYGGGGGKLIWCIT